MRELTGKRITIDNQKTNINSIYTDCLIQMATIADTDPDQFRYEDTLMKNPIIYISCLHRLRMDDWCHLLDLYQNSYR